MKLALVQMHSGKGEIARNLARIAAFAHRAAAAGAEIACFPEASITGYADPRTHVNAVVGWGDPELTPLFELSKRTGLMLVAGIVERNAAGAPFMSQGVIRGGSLVGTYRKINLAPNEIGLFSPGAEPLLWRQGDVDFGVAVCADIESEGCFRDMHRAERRSCCSWRRRACTVRRARGTGKRATRGGATSAGANWAPTRERTVST